MRAGLIDRYLARQFAHPKGWIGERLIAPWLDRISGPINRLAVAELRLSGAEDVLEVGFGGGALLALLLGKTQGRVHGIDVSEAALARAGRRFGRELEQGRLSIARAPAECLPLADASVDRACAVETLYFWPDPTGAFAELARVLRRGGRLVIGLEPPEELRRWPGHRFGFRLYEIAEVRALMEAAGFGAIEEAWGSGRKPALFCCLSGVRLPANG